MVMLIDRIVRGSYYEKEPEGSLRYFIKLGDIHMISELTYDFFYE